MADINYGIRVMENNLKNIISATKSLESGMRKISLQKEEVIDEMDGYRHMALSSFSYDIFGVEKTKTYINNNLYKITSGNYLTYEMPDELRKIIHLYFTDKKKYDESIKDSINFAKTEISHQNNKNEDLKSDIEKIHQEMDKIHSFFTQKKDMYILYRKIAPIILESNPSLKDFDLFISKDTTGSGITIEEINHGLNTLESYFASSGVFTKWFNKDKLHVIEKVTEYDRIHKRTFLKDLRSFLIAKNKLSILMDRIHKIESNLKEPDKTELTQYEKKEQHLSAERYEFRKILEAAQRDYFHILDTEEAYTETKEINRVLGGNIRYILLRRNKKVLSEAIMQYEVFIKKLYKEKANISKGLEQFRRAQRDTCGIKSIQDKHLMVLNKIDYIFTDIQHIANDFNEDIEKYINKVCQSREILVDSDIRDIGLAKSSYSISVPDIEDIPSLPPFEEEDINVENKLKGLAY